MNCKHFKYIIVAPSYDENNGGCVVLHKLCDLLNSQGEKAVLCPMIDNDYFLDSNNIVKSILRRSIHLKSTLQRFHLLFDLCRKMKTNKKWNTPVTNPFSLFFNISLSDSIVVYPEILSGNILHAKHVVRYLMHNPGNFTHKIDYGEGELYFRYSDSFAREYVPPKNSVISPHYLKISTTPECYNMNNVAVNRKGTAYMIRKGKNKKIVHDLNNSILLDGLSHEEIASVFKSVKSFISYDSITAYTNYALLCGCKSIVVLGENEKAETYRPNEEARRYILFGINDKKKVNQDEARLWAEKLRNNQDKISKESTQMFVKESQIFFNKHLLYYK